MAIFAARRIRQFSRAREEVNPSTRGSIFWGGHGGAERSESGTRRRAGAQLMWGPAERCLVALAGFDAGLDAGQIGPLGKGCNHWSNDEGEEKQSQHKATSQPRIMEIYGL